MTMIIDKNDHTYRNFVEAKQIYSTYTETERAMLVSIVNEQAKNGLIRIGAGLTAEDFCSIEGIEHQVELFESESIANVFYYTYDRKEGEEVTTTICRWNSIQLKAKHVEDD